MGRPKALVDGWLRAAVRALHDGGCEEVVVVLGAEAEKAAELVPGERVVVATDWSTGMGASLRVGLAALEPTSHEAALIHLVDLPDVKAAVVARLRGYAGPDSLARAVFSGEPGHPVLFGRHHWVGAAASATGDHGARDYLRAHQVRLVECGDLATGRDRDTR
ncbi:nucleotidyltransferase family protein [soil metagenome]